MSLCLPTANKEDSIIQSSPAACSFVDWQFHLSELHITCKLDNLLQVLDHESAVLDDVLEFDNVHVLRPVNQHFVSDRRPVVTDTYFSRNNNLWLGRL